MVWPCEQAPLFCIARTTLPLIFELVPGLQSLSLSRNSLSGTLPFELALPPTLKQLIVWGNKIGGPLSGR
jgi:hypothetical protein